MARETFYATRTATEGAFYRDIGKKIAAARKRRKFTQQVLADKLEISRASLANMESGRQRMYLYDFLRIASSLGIK